MTITEAPRPLPLFVRVNVEDDFVRPVWDDLFSAADACGARDVSFDADARAYRFLLPDARAWTDLVLTLRPFADVLSLVDPL